MSQRFQVDLRGIIDLAANHLYSSQEVFVRELIQNAVDAVTARARREPAARGLIRFELTPAPDGPATLCVHDDGIGLTPDEVHSFLSTVGGSSKREDAESLAERLAGDDEGFLGRFGIGLLSCFMVTDEIVVHTRSAREANSPAVEWRGRSDGSYSVRELIDSPMAAGTSVYLRCKPDAEEYFERDRLIELVRQFGEMLRTPIVVAIGTESVSINQERPPWDMELADEMALSDFCEQKLGFRPLDVFRIEARAGAVQGYGFIRPDHAARYGGKVRLYCRGMYVGDDVSDLVPDWATFVGCVLNSQALRLTASRESLHEDEALEHSCEQVGAAIRARLAHLLRIEPKKFETVMGVHDTEIRGLAVKDSEFFELIIDLLEFETSLGTIRFGEFWRENERLLVSRTTQQYRRLSRLSAELGLRVFNAGHIYHEELLTRAIERHPDIELRSFDATDIADLLAAPDDARQYARLLEAGNEALSERSCVVDVRAFRPDDLPTFYALGTDAELHLQIDQTKAISSGLWREMLELMAPRLDRPAPPRLCLNANNRLIRRLASLRDPTVMRIGIQILYVQSLMSGQHALSADESTMLNHGMEQLLERVADPGGTS